MSDTNNNEHSNLDFSALGEILGAKADVLSRQELETIGNDAKVQLRTLVDTTIWEKGDAESLKQEKNRILHQLHINHSLQHEHNKEEVVAMLKDIETHVRSSINRTTAHFKELTQTPELPANFFSIYPVKQRPESLWQQQEVILSELEKSLKYKGASKGAILNAIDNGLSTLIKHHEFFQDISYLREAIIRTIKLQSDTQIAQLFVDMDKA